MTRIAVLAASALVPVLACGWSVLTAQSAGWLPARPGYQFQFPRDHASHPEYKLEWWYYTGQLASQDGRRFGYQLTFFRVGVDAAPANPSRWSVRDLFMTHVAITDIDRSRFWFAERLNRAGVGWAGADVGTYRVWNEDWEAHLDESGAHRLRAAQDGFGIDLALVSDRPPVIHGVDGVSVKGDQPGNGSHYYSLTRAETTGTLTLDGRRFAVRGSSWMDHEFGTSFLEPGQRGWNWFALQLDDGTDLMVYDFTRDDDLGDSHSSGTLVNAGGESTRLLAGDFSLQPMGEPWVSSASDGAYPVDWQIRVPATGLDLRVRAAIPGQELVTQRSGGVAYWEGAVIVDGTREGRVVGGRGYLEMTGYAGRSITDVLQ